MHFKHGVFILYLVLAIVVFLCVGPLVASVFNVRGSMTPLLIAISVAGSIVLIGMWRSLGALFHFSLGATLTAILTLQIPVIILIQAKKSHQLQQAGLFLLVAWIIGVTIYLLDRAGVRMQSSQSDAQVLAQNLSVEWVKSVEQEWLEKPRVTAGRRKNTDGTPDYFVLIREGASALLRVDLYAESDEVFAFKDWAAWDSIVALGWGNRISLVNLQSQSVSEFPLGAYFGSMKLLDGQRGLLVASAERLFLINLDGSLAWQSEALGVDGVVIGEIAGGIISGQGEWDPPGGWKPFQVRLNSGHTVSAGQLD